MIIPVAFKISRADSPEDFSDQLLGPSLSPVTHDAVIDVEISLYDTESGRGGGFSARAVRRPDAEPWHDTMATLMTFNGVSGSHLDYLRKLRDHIDEVLSEEER